uniref:hypothetical protein n=1 Tax=Chlorobium limicola TaxID=1092 RepID=UPI001E346AE6|nr:hypothetical protein [Chlorobium limicola]
MNDPEGITYHHTVFCQTGLPYRNPGENIRLWEQKQGKAILEVSAGRVINPSTFEFVNVGLPFGPNRG